MQIESVNEPIIAVRRSQYPEDKKSEFLLVGRSNVGKSSFINTLIERKNFARTSSKPGETQTLNFYLVNDAFYLVDVPGYGYASVSKDTQKKFGLMIEEYLKSRENLKHVFMLIDYRHKPTEDDVLMYEFLKYYNLDITIVATKYDKVSKNITVTINPTVLADDLVKMYKNATKFSAKFTDSTGKALVNSDVRFNINGVFYTRTTDVNGVASLAINLRPGDYIITTIFDGLDIGNKVTVLPTLVTKDLNMKYMDGSNFTAQTLDSQGKALANQTVSFNVNGVFYHRITNEDGIASLRIRLMAGEYIITSYWNNFQTGNTIKISP